MTLDNQVLRSKMLEHTFSGGPMQAIFSTVPWLKPFLEWAFAILITLVVLATPAYFLLLPTARKFRSGMTAMLQRLREEHKSNRVERRARFEAYLNRFTLNHLLR